MSSLVALRRFTVEQFHAMGRTGILAPDERIELIDGELIAMAPIVAPHLQTVNRLTRALILAVGDAAIVSVQNPVVLADDSEPQPDVSLLRKESETAVRIPDADDVLLVIEVADTTLQYDRRIKLPLYAKHGIREVWIVNLEDGVVEIHRQPKDGSYRIKLERGAGDGLAPSALPSAEIALSTVLAT
jgi:Uma2 family endonuclease